MNGTKIRRPNEQKGRGYLGKENSALDNYASYKYAITGTDGVTVFKIRSVCAAFETAPRNASKLYFPIINGEMMSEKRRKSNIYESRLIFT